MGKTRQAPLSRQPLKELHLPWLDLTATLVDYELIPVLCICNHILLKECLEFNSDWDADVLPPTSNGPGV